MTFLNLVCTFQEFLNYPSEGRSRLRGNFPQVIQLSFRDASPKQCLQLKIRTKNVQNQTKNGPNFNEKTD